MKWKLGTVLGSLFVLAGAAGCSGGGDHPRAAPATSTTAAPVSSTTTRAEGTAARTVRPSTTAAVAHLDIVLLRTNAHGSHHLSLRAAVQGLVPQLYSDTDGTPLAGPDQNLNVRVSFGDGSPETGSDGGGVSCKPGAHLVPIAQTFNYEYDYAKPGTYTVTFKELVCQLGVVTKTTTITVV